MKKKILKIQRGEGAVLCVFVQLDAFGTFIYRNGDYFESIRDSSGHGSKSLALVTLCNLHVKQNDTCDMLHVCKTYINHRRQKKTISLSTVVNYK